MSIERNKYPRPEQKETTIRDAGMHEIKNRTVEIPTGDTAKSDIEAVGGISKETQEEFNRSLEIARHALEDEARNRYGKELAELDNQQVDEVAEAAHNRLDPERGGDETAQKIITLMAADRIEQSLR